MKKVLENGKEYKCTRFKNGTIMLYYYANGQGDVYKFDDIKHNGYLSNVSYFVTPDGMILEVTLIDFINFVTGSVSFKGRIHILD